MPMNVEIILVNLVLTALIYGVGPIAFLLFRKHPLSTRNLKIFHITYTVVVALFFAACNSMAGDRVNFYPAVIWGWVFYKICKSQFEKKDLLDAVYNDNAQERGDISATRHSIFFIQPQYIDASNTPLLFYKFLSRFSFLLGILAGLGRLVQAVGALSSTPANIIAIAWIDVVFACLSVAFCIAIVVTLNQMSWIGVVLCYSFWGMAIFSHLLTIAVAYYYGVCTTDIISKAIANIVVVSILLVCSWIYFSKRRLLFTPLPSWYPMNIPNAQEHHPAEETAAPQPEPTPIVCTYQSDFEIKEPPTPPVTAEVQAKAPAAKKYTSKPLKWSVVALAVLLAVSIAGNVYQAVDAANNQREVSELQSELEKQKRAVTTLRTGKDQLAKQVRSLKDEIAELEDYNDFATEYAIAGLFMYDSIGFIVSGSRYYHRYDCPIFQDADSYWAHNIEYCAGQGYSRHSACWED